jgi:N-acetylglucosamine-6-phosphate deacetylase
MAAFDAGVSGVTHLFNAMSAFVPRAPCLVGAALDRRGSFAGIIVDGHHVHYAAVRMAFAVKGPGALLLVSDAMPTVASELPAFVLNGERIRLEGGRLLNDAGTLAGAHITVADAVRNAVRHGGLPLPGVLRMATRTPADAVGLGENGRIEAGSHADFVALDRDLNVAAVWQHGKRLR